MTYAYDCMRSRPEPPLKTEIAGCFDAEVSASNIGTTPYTSLCLAERFGQQVPAATHDFLAAIPILVQQYGKRSRRSIAAAGCADILRWYGVMLM